MSASTKALPTPTPETAPYWEGARAGELRIQRCRACTQAYFYPRPYCPQCGSADVEWFVTSGRATLASYIISERAAPGFDAPYAIAIVELEEGPRMMTNIVEVEPTPERLVLDMALEVRFEDRGEITVPVFAPAGQAVEA
ncbi:Zn-ribbon domain-containing OB-fold protein [Nocardioides sp. Iso805N]|uniref:Zn-ribbon domain-containing OB-fold protein n=1 Tax=Nocardioides sp. Iso805N TaxID=1283287 RepID=UPI0003761646|nr:OB-fold domain-containing protein [Nocardioides sp. Iso805N]